MMWLHVFVEQVDLLEDLDEALALPKLDGTLALAWVITDLAWRFEVNIGTAQGLATWFTVEVEWFNSRFLS
jgi:hypothetical protein